MSSKGIRGKVGEMSLRRIETQAHRGAHEIIIVTGDQVGIRAETREGEEAVPKGKNVSYVRETICHSSVLREPN